MHSITNASPSNAMEITRKYVTVGQPSPAYCRNHTITVIEMAGNGKAQPDAGRTFDLGGI